MVPVEDSSGSSNRRLPSATLAAVGGLPGGLGTKAGRANLAFSAASGSSAAARALSGAGPVGNEQERGEANASAGGECRCHEAPT